MNNKAHIAKWLFNNTRSICYQDLLYVQKGGDNFVVDAVHDYAKEHTAPYIELLKELEDFCYDVASEDTVLYNQAKQFAYKIEELLKGEEKQ